MLPREWLFVPRYNEGDDAMAAFTGIIIGAGLIFIMIVVLIWWMVVT